MKKNEIPSWLDFDVGLFVVLSDVGVIVNGGWRQS